MTDIQMLTWAIAGGFAGTWVIMGAIFTLMLSFKRELKGDIFKLDTEIKGSLCKLDTEIKGSLCKLDEKIMDIDRRLCRIEGAMMNKECCMLYHDHKSKVE